MTNILTNDEIRRVAPSVFATRAHEDCSDRYGFISTAEVVDALRDNNWMPVKAHQVNTRISGKRDFAKHMLRFRQTGADAPMMNVGDSAIELVLTNSHDRTSGFILHAGVFRLVCLNGMVVSDDTFQRVSVRHSRYSAERVVKGSHEIIREVPAIAAEVEGMQALNLSRAEQEIFARTASGLFLPEPKEGEKRLTTDADIIGQILRPKRRDDQGSDLWTTYNVIQEKALRGGIRTTKRNAAGDYRRSTTREIKSIDKNIKLNKPLWEMAQQMKALKEAA